MPIFMNNGVRLYYEVHGEGIPILLVAGLASDSQSWQPIVEELSKHYRVIIFDNRGSGRTKPQEMEIRIQDIAEDCISLIQHIGLSSVALLGHSMGGFVALDVAIRYPEYISKLILLGTSAFNSKRNNALFEDWATTLKSEMDAGLWFRNIFYWIFSKRFFEEKDTLAQSTRFAVEYPYPQTATAFAHQVSAIKQFNCAGNLSRIESKTLLLCGKEDLLFSPEESFEVLQAIPNLFFTIIEQAAHSIHVENPTEFLRLVREFLDC